MSAVSGNECRDSVREGGRENTAVEERVVSIIPGRGKCLEAGGVGVRNRVCDGVVR
jgi:hypothetical protein